MTDEITNEKEEEEENDWPFIVEKYQERESSLYFYK